MSVWAIIGNTESSDKFLYVFDHRLSEEMALEFLKIQMPYEFESVGFVNFKIQECPLLAAGNLLAPIANNCIEK